MISIIGAGPAGGQSAYLLAKKGYDVNIYEEHASVGKPFQCTGLATPILEKLAVPDKKLIRNSFCQ